MIKVLVKDFDIADMQTAKKGLNFPFRAKTPLSKGSVLLPAMLINEIVKDDLKTFDVGVCFQWIRGGSWGGMNTINDFCWWRYADFEEEGLKFIKNYFEKSVNKELFDRSNDLKAKDVFYVDSYLPFFRKDNIDNSNYTTLIYPYNDNIDEIEQIYEGYHIVILHNDKKYTEQEYLDIYKE